MLDSWVLSEGSSSCNLGPQFGAVRHVVAEVISGKVLRG